MTVASIDKASFGPVSPPAQTGALKGRAVSKQPVGDKQSSAWAKICKLLREFVAWLKKVFSSPETPASLPLVSLSPPVVDPSFLKSKDPAYNLKRMSEISPENATPSLYTEAIYKSLPRKNPIRMGYTDPVQYQTALGDKAIALQTALTALGIIGLSRGMIASCMAGMDASNVGRAYHICRNGAASFWQDTSGKTVLTGCALLLAASLFAHRKGWLGPLFHDRSLQWRGRQIEALFKDAAEELGKKISTDPVAAEEIAKHLLEHLDLIEATLRVELQISQEKVTKIVELLRTSIERALDPDLRSPS